MSTASKVGVVRGTKHENAFSKEDSGRSMNGGGVKSVRVSK